MIKQLDYTGKMCVASLPFVIYKHVDTIDCLVPYEVNPEDILMIISCDYHNTIFDHLDAILDRDWETKGKEATHIFPV